MNLNRLLVGICILIIAEPAFALRCGNRLVNDGDHKSKILRYCGEPTAIQTRTIVRAGFPARQIRRHRVDFPERDLMFSDRAYVEVIVEEWTYNLGPRRLMRTIKFENEEILLGDSFNIHLIELDMNLNPESIDTVKIDVLSDSDVAGIEIDAVETGENTGYFVAEVSLSNKQSSSGNRLFALAGDNIFAKYDDYTLPKPYSISDSLELQVSSTADSKIPPVERLSNSDLFLADNSGNETDSFNSDGQIQIVGKVTNFQDFSQNFVCMFQVKDSANSVIHLSWIRSQIFPMQTLELSQSWIPNSPGNYSVESFVWNSLEDPIVLSPSLSTSIVVE